MTKFTSEQASQIASEYYNISAKASKLDGYVDENFLLKTTSGEKFLLKISSEENSEKLDFQIQILKQLWEVINSIIQEQHLQQTFIQISIH